MTLHTNNFGSVLCQDCLRIAPYSDARHNADEKCPCGGDFCACLDCECVAILLKGGVRYGPALRLQDPDDLPFWCEVTGTIQPSPEPA